MTDRPLDPGYEQQRRRVRRLQNWVIAMAVLIVFLGIAAPAAVIIFFNEQAQEAQAEADQTQLDVACTSVRSDIAQLNALSKFAKQLGVPVTWEIPELPSECEQV